MHTYAHTHAHTHMHTQHMHTYAHTCTYTHTHVQYTYAHICTHTCTYTHAHTTTHTLAHNSGVPQIDIPNSIVIQNYSKSFTISCAVPYESVECSGSVSIFWLNEVSTSVSVRMFVCVCVCVCGCCVCAHVCMCVCMHVWMLCVCACLYVCVCVRVWMLCVCACLYAYLCTVPVFEHPIGTRGTNSISGHFQSCVHSQHQFLLHSDIPVSPEGSDRKICVRGY